MKRCVLSISAGLGLGFSAICSGHHSRAHFFQEVTEMDGVLERVEWQNPHVYFAFRARDAQGRERHWAMEAGSPYELKRAGVTRDLFRVGEPVKVAGSVSRARPGAFLVTNMLFGEGDEIVVLPTARPRWNGEGIGGRDQWVADADRLKDVEPAPGAGIFRVWSVPRVGGGHQQLPFTEAALEARKLWDPVDNPITRCEPPGMPRIMFNPHPFEFVDEGDRIMLYGEEFDMVRTIHLRSDRDPAEQPPSKLGYSVGHWEENTLVVETSRIDWPYFDSFGTPQSDAVEIVERFAVSDDEKRLDYHVTITDPATFTGPAVVQGYRLALGETVEPYECEVF